jgi:hypothetical protein
MSDVGSANVPFQIDAISQGQRVDNFGNVVDTYVVKWHSPLLGYFTTNIDEANFTPQEAAQIIQQKANDLMALHNQVNSMHGGS